MRLHQIFLGFFLFMSASDSFAQRILYSEPEKDDSRRMNFEIIGKVGGNFLIYKNIRNKNFITVYDNEMEQTSKEEMEYIPEDKLINVDFFPYTDFTYVIYEYQKKNVVYCNAVKIDGSGKLISDVMSLDTSHIGFSANNKIYSTIISEDKSHLMVFKVNSRNKSKYIVTTILYDNNLHNQKRSRFVLSMDEHNDFLDEFSLDNVGDLVFSKFTRNNNETITNTSLLWKEAMSDSLLNIDVPQNDILLDEIHIKVDNHNKRYFLTSFYYKQKKGNVDGFFFFVWDKDTRTPVLEN